MHSSTSPPPLTATLLLKLRAPGRSRGQVPVPSTGHRGHRGGCELMAKPCAGTGQDFTSLYPPPAFGAACWYPEQIWGCCAPRGTLLSWLMGQLTGGCCFPRHHRMGFSLQDHLCESHRVPAPPFTPPSRCAVAAAQLFGTPAGCTNTQ